MKLFSRAQQGRSTRRVRGIALALGSGLLLPLTAVGFSAFTATPASAAITHAEQNGTLYVAVHPFRVADTRPNSGQFGAGQTLTSGRVLTVPIGGTGNCNSTGPFIDCVPYDATAIVVNITVINPTKNGWVEAYADGQPAPNPPTSTVNFLAGQTIANEATITLFQTVEGNSVIEGNLNILNYIGTVDVTVDVQGFYFGNLLEEFNTGPLVGGYMNPPNNDPSGNPIRVLDTRTNSGQQGAGETIGAGQTLNFYPGTIPLTNQLDPNVPEDANAVVLNITVVNPTAASFFSVWQAGSGPIGTFSNLNFLPGNVVANRVIVPLSPENSGGPPEQVSIYNYAGSADVVVDLNGFMDIHKGDLYYGLTTPLRISDTRAGSGQPNAGNTLGAGNTVDVNVFGDHTYDSDCFYCAPTAGNWSGINANLTAADLTGSSFFTAFPGNAGGPPPLSSDINWTPGELISNGLIEDNLFASEPDFTLDIYNFAGNADAITDLYGYYGCFQNFSQDIVNRFANSDADCSSVGGFRDPSVNTN
jgi:hypothetical protein